MPFTLGGNKVQVYDFITADQIEGPNESNGFKGDQILVNNIDPVEVASVIDSGEAIMVKGYSHATGDSVEYIFSSDTEVGLWGA
jgi:hypothetical protein